MQRVECRLGQQPDGHQRERYPRGGLGTDSGGQQEDVERAVGGVQQRGPEQIECGAKQREEQIAQCGGEGLGATVQADQRHRRKSQ